MLFQYQARSVGPLESGVADTSTEWFQPASQPTLRKQYFDRSVVVEPIGVYDVSAEWYMPTSQPTLLRVPPDKSVVVKPIGEYDVSFQWFHETSQPVLRRRNIGLWWFTAGEEIVPSEDLAPDFTARLGTSNSYLGNIVLGYGSSPAPPPAWYPTTIKHKPAQPEPKGIHQERKTPIGYLSGLTPVPNLFLPVPNRQKIDDNQPGYQEPLAHHMHRQFPFHLLAGLPVVPPPDLIRLKNVPLLSRDPSMAPVLRRFTDIVSGVFNSLTRSGQLIQTGPAEFQISLTPTIFHLTPGSQPAASLYYGTIWVDSLGRLHYLMPSGEDVALGSASGLITDTDGTLAANSDLRVATQKATKTYVDTSVQGLMEFQGEIDCSSQPNYPAAFAGDFYRVEDTGEGRIGGASGKIVKGGNLIIATVDNAGGDEAAVGDDWFVSGTSRHEDLFGLLGGTTGEHYHLTFLEYFGTGTGLFFVKQDSPTLTGTPAAPTAALGTSTTQLATTAFVATAIAAKATINLTGQTADVAAATLYAVPSTGAGMYQVSAYIVLTTAASVSSTLPNVQVIFTDVDSNTSVTIDATPILGVAGTGQTGALTANTLGTIASGVICINVKLSTTIQYQTVNYASTAAGMAYALHIVLEKL